MINPIFLYSEISPWCVRLHYGKSVTSIWSFCLLYHINIGYKYHSFHSFHTSKFLLVLLSYALLCLVSITFSTGADMMDCDKAFDWWRETLALIGSPHIKVNSLDDVVHFLNSTHNCWKLFSITGKYIFSHSKLILSMITQLYCIHPTFFYWACLHHKRRAHIRIYLTSCGYCRREARAEEMDTAVSIRENKVSCGRNVLHHCNSWKIECRISLLRRSFVKQHKSSISNSLRSQCVVFHVWLCCFIILLPTLPKKTFTQLTSVCEIYVHVLECSDSYNHVSAMCNSFICFYLQAVSWRFRFNYQSKI